MPETSMDEYDGLVLRKDDVRLSREILPVQPESETVLVQPASYDHFRLRVLPADPGHQIASLFRGKQVCHSQAVRGEDASSLASISGFSSTRRRLTCMATW